MRFSAIDAWMWVAAALAAATLFALFRYWLRDQTGRFRRRRGMARGLRKEREARGVLRQMGFQIVDEQVEYRHVILSDGRRLAPPIRIDYLVSRGGRRYVVEVKSGRVSTDLFCADTRRQILEYAVAVPCDGVYLLDMESRRLSRVEFPRLSVAGGGGASRRVLAVAAAFAAGVAAGWLLWG